MLRDVSTVHTGATLLGTDFRLPIGVAPMTLQRAADPGGEVTMATAAERLEYEQAAATRREVRS